MSTWTVNVKRLEKSESSDVWIAKVYSSNSALASTTFTAGTETDLRAKVREYCIEHTPVPDGKSARAVLKRTWEVSVRVEDIGTDEDSGDVFSWDLFA